MKQPTTKTESPPPPATPQPPSFDLVLMVSKQNGDEVRVKPMHVPAWEYKGYSVKEK